MKKRLKKIYIDTSVAGGYFEKEFSEDTKEFFRRARKGEFILIVSTLLENELLEAPSKVRNHISKLKKKFVLKITHNPQAETLAANYISAGVVGKTSIEDCRHIALATICRADVLVSWNFRHIVNVDRINGYNSVNLKFNYKSIDIRTPKEVLNYEI